MKTKLHYIATALFLTNIATAQVLYTENFDNLTIGNLGTDITGQTPGQGGWYTLAANLANYPVSNSDFKITPETNKGNILEIDLPAKNTGINTVRSIFREDIPLFWNNRTPNHNIFKLSFDFYTGKARTEPRLSISNYISLHNQKGHVITNLCFDRSTKQLKLYIPSHRVISPTTSGHTIATLPTDSWVTIELFVDYNTNKFYVSIPSLNLTQVFNSLLSLSLTDPVSPEYPTVNDSPVKLWLLVGSHSASQVLTSSKSKYDNINISAINTAPTVSVSNFISNKFNLYPNPAKNVITITNNENINIEKVEVYDITGKQLQTKLYNSTNEIQFNTANLAVGTYFLHITTNQGLGIKKFIKQ